MSQYVIYGDMEKNKGEIAKDGYTLDDSRFENIKAWSMLLMHMNDAAVSLSLLEKESKSENQSSIESFIISQSLLRNSLMNYAKCFSESGSGRITLDKNQYFKSEPKLLDTHTRVMELRNKFLAHSDTSGLDSVLISTKEFDTYIHVRPFYALITPTEEIPNYLALFQHCATLISEKIRKCSQKIENELGKTVKIGGR